MFEYCRARHVDKTNRSFGNVAFAIMDLRSKYVLRYYAENSDFLKLQVHDPIMRLDEIVQGRFSKIKSLKEMFQAAEESQTQFGELQVQCFQVPAEQLLPIVMNDAAAFNAEDQRILQSLIAESFS
jgi:hypothetical protein